MARMPKQPKKYFWDPPGTKLGLKADIKRHKEAVADLEHKIAVAEKERNGLAATWRNFRCLLEQNLAELVAKVGRKK